MLRINTKLVQPILSKCPEPNHDINDVLTLDNFLELLREEEDYFSGEQHNTKLMITRLRKIFYDKWGWNTQLIRKAAYVEGRYEVDIVDCSENNEKTFYAKKVRRYHQYKNKPKCRLVAYRANDRIYGRLKDNESPFIYIKNYQSVLLPDDYFCDIAHILAGLDAYNYPQVVSPMPNFLSPFSRMIPYVQSNMDTVTWLGDLATIACDFLFHYLDPECKPIDLEDEQKYIESGAPGSDMLGNIDAFVISKCYNISNHNGERVTDILKNYYYEVGEEDREKRIHIFTEAVGLKGWDGNCFANEENWITIYEKQLRNNTAFQTFSLSEAGINKFVLPYKIWRGRYNEVIKCELLLRLFITAIKDLLQIRA